MRAVRLTRLGKPLENADVPVPEIGPTEVLIRVAAVGICHSDAHYRAGISKIDSLPLILGHEVAGRVEDVASIAENTATEITLTFSSQCQVDMDVPTELTITSTSAPDTTPTTISVTISKPEP